MILIRQGKGEDSNLFTVGCSEQIGPEDFIWTALKDCNSEEEAMAWVSYLNGGVHPQVNPRRANWQ